MVVQIKERYYSPEDYLELESAAETKSEYRDGEIVQMTIKYLLATCVCGYLIIVCIFIPMSC